MIVVSYHVYACLIFSTIILGAHNLDGAWTRGWLSKITATNNLVRASKPTSSQTYIPFLLFPDEISVLFLQDIFLDVFGLDSPFIRFHEIILAVGTSFCRSRASQSTFSSPSAGARDDDFECAHDSGSSKRFLGSILKRLHVRLMMSVKIGIFACRGFCAFTRAKREEKSSFSFEAPRTV